VIGFMELIRGAWSTYWASDPVTLVMSGMVLGFIGALLLAKIRQHHRSRSENRTGSEPDSSGRSVANSHNMCV
jgi:hypothetical protein